MSLIREAGFDPSSPQSSRGGVDSVQATPDTRLTSFSPKDSSTKSSKPSRAPNSGGFESQPIRFPVKPCSGNSVQTGKDPFTAGPHTRALQQKLSPTASAFRPLAANQATSLQAAPSASSMGGLGHTVSSELSTEVGLSRCLVIYVPGQKLSAADAETCLSGLEITNILGYGQREVHERGDCVYVQFSDIRDAYAISGKVKLLGKDAEARSIPPAEYAEAVGHALSPAAAQSAQVVVVAFAAVGANLDDYIVEAVVQCLLQSSGPLFALQKQASFNSGAYRAVAEFCDATIAALFVINCNYSIVNGIHIIISLNTSDGTAGSPRLDMSDGRVPPRLTYQSLSNTMQNMALVGSGRPQIVPQGAMVTAMGHPYGPLDVPTGSTFAMCPVVYQRPLQPSLSYALDHTGTVDAGQAGIRGSYPLQGTMYAAMPSILQVPARHGQNCAPYSRPDSRRHIATRGVSRSPFYNVPGHHNHVDVNRIRDGIDVRTTIMLRNIPNKVDQAMLKRIIDESSWGKYDFMYLRIDFANDCNVGYAFVNFVDPLDIIDFATARANQRWNCFKSDKVAEISYATIQGKDCLVQKFRNSSVMLEAPHYRPKLYYTTNGPSPELAGQEEPFPQPDNQSKMKRSCENAEHVGLFTPNAGQHFREEQRRRRSQFDRGTRLAALEEYDFDTAMQQHLFSP